MNSQLEQEYGYAEPPSGWLFFAGTILGIAGIMRIFDGIWAFRYDGALPDGLEGAVLGTSLSTYGWLWIIVGIILILASFAVLARSQFARWIGIIRAQCSPSRRSGGCRTTPCGHSPTSSSVCSSSTDSRPTAAAAASVHDTVRDHVPSSCASGVLPRANIAR